MKPAIIFDFDSTIADSFPLVLHIAHELLGEELPKDDISRLRGLSGVWLLRALHIPLWQAWIIVARIRRRMRRRIAEIPLVPGMDATLCELARTHRLFVLSSNSPANVRAFLQRHDVDNCFTKIYSGITPWRKSCALRKLVRRWRLDPPETWYVGDTDLDVAAAHHAGLRVAAVAWGFSNVHILEKHQPDLLVFDPEELTKQLG